MNRQPPSITALNFAPAAEFAAALADVFDSGAWVATAVTGWRPFADLAELHEAMAAVVMAASREERLNLLRAAPGLDDLRGLPELSADDAALLRDLDRRFHERFGFPFIIAKRNRSRDDVLAEYARRWETAMAMEEATALAELLKVAHERLETLTTPDAAAGWLSAQVIDAAAGHPACGVALVLSRVDDIGRRHRLVSAATNAEGRADQPLLAGGDLTAGRYSLDVLVADHFRAQGVVLADPPFIDVVTIPFGVADPALHHHLLLLISPNSYSVQRGG